MSRIGIYAPNPDGHRFKYVQYLISHISQDMNDIFVLTTDKGLQSPNYAVHLLPMADRFTPHIIESSYGRDLALHARALATHLMIHPDGDTYVWKQAWWRGWKGPGALSALIMRPNGQHEKASFRLIGTLTKRALMMIANARKNVSVFELKSSLWDSSTYGFGVPDPISFHPDQSALSELITKDMRQPPTKWVGIVGALTSRKNIDLVLQSARFVERSNFGIMLAGKIDSSIRTVVDAEVSHLNDEGIPVVVLNKLLTDGQLDAILELLHCVVLAHSNEGPSGILGKAVEAGTYVVAAGANSLRIDCQALEAARWSNLKSEEIAHSIEIALDTKTVQKRKLHTETIFATRLLNEVPQKAGTC